MKTWIRTLIWSLISAPIIRAVAWTDDEAKTFDSFCRSSCGRKFLELLRQTTAGATFNAFYANQSVSANGYARGMQDLLGLVYRLRSFPPEAESAFSDEDIEPIPSQRDVFDGRRFNFGSGGSAINSR